MQIDFNPSTMTRATAEDVARMYRFFWGKKNSMMIHVCNGCGDRQYMDANKKQWHDCHPAKFVYMVETDKILVSQIVKAMKG